MSVLLTYLAPRDQISAFVAVGQRMSITLAANDLFLSQSAISRQIEGLEETLGVRRHRALHLTPEGERLFRSADSDVQQLQDVVGTLANSRQHRPVTVTASTGVAGLWLLPRIARFQRAHPDFEVRVTADNRLLDLPSAGVDLAIRYCRSAPGYCSVNRSRR
jgi:DNA-binding transcriptional LysR family regulator